MKSTLRTLAVALLVAMLAGSCGQQRSETPEQAYEDFFAISYALAREPQAALQQELWERIDPASRKAIEALAETVNAKLPAEARVAPYRLLTGRDTPLGGRIAKMEIVERGEAEITLLVSFDAGEARVKMLRDGDRWLVALPPPVTP